MARRRWAVRLTDSVTRPTGIGMLATRFGRNRGQTLSTPHSPRPVTRFVLLLAAMLVSAPTWFASVASAADPIESANARFAAAAYRDVLGRDPDAAGLDFHLGRMASGGDQTREAFTYGLLFSVEGSRLEVDRAYEDLLGRAADPTGRTYWTDHLAGHGVLDLRVLLLSSDEFHRRSGGTDRAWITALYHTILDREPDPSGLAYWLELVGDGTPRPLIVAGIYLGDESLGRRADAYHREILDRPASHLERPASIALIRTAGERALRARILSSDEAFEPYLREALS